MRHGSPIKFQKGPLNHPYTLLKTFESFIIMLHFNSIWDIRQFNHAHKYLKGPYKLIPDYLPLTLQVKGEGKPWREGRTHPHNKIMMQTQHKNSQSKRQPHPPSKWTHTQNFPHWTPAVVSQDSPPDHLNTHWQSQWYPQMQLPTTCPCKQTLNLPRPSNIDK